MINATNSSTTTPANRRNLDRLRIALDHLLAEVLRRGFYGSAAVEIVIEDGTIQYIRHRVEQVQR